MADPKYADLPGIAHGEPDVYETKDLPESEQTSDFYEDENDCIEKLSISASEAFNKFKGTNINAIKIDFSDRISRRMRTGYDVSGEWEIAAQGEKETPLQKYQRLQCEMSELLEEVNKINTEKKSEVNDCTINAEQVQQALKKLNDLQLEECLGKDFITSISDPQGAQLKKLFSQLEQFKSEANNKPESENASEDAIVYQFNYRPDQVRLMQTTRIAELESRLHRLENVLGANDDKLARLCAATSKDTLIETADHLSATASMLDSAQLDHIEGRLTALVQKLDMINEKRSKISEDAEKDKLILELYELVKNTENISKVLPSTIERLKALETIHERSANFLKSLTQVEKIQSEIQGNVENNKALLKGVQESFAHNLEEINKTIQNLDGRIKALAKK